MINKGRKIIPLLFLLIVFLMLVSGCAFGSEPEDANKSSLEEVLNNLFIGPDDKLIELVNDPSNQTIIGEGADKEKKKDESSELDDYLKSIYKPYFTDNVYQDFIAVYSLMVPLNADENNYKTNISRIDIEETDKENRRYSFTVQVTYTDTSDDEENSKLVDVEGYANFSKEGKISRFRITDDNGLLMTHQ